MPSFCSVSSKSGFTYFSLLSASSTAISKICPLSVPRITSLVDAAAQKIETINNRQQAQNSTINWILNSIEITFGDVLTVPGDGIDEESAETGELLGAGPPGVVVVRLRAALVDHRGDAVLAAGVQEHPVHRVVPGAACPEVEICGEESKHGR